MKSNEGSAVAMPAELIVAPAAERDTAEAHSLCWFLLSRPASTSVHVVVIIGGPVAL